MSAQDTKKAKRRKIKKVPGKLSSLALQNEPENSPRIEAEDLKEIEKFMDATYHDCDTTIPPLSRGPNPYLGGERCLLCRCERPDPPQAANIKAEAEDKSKSEDANSLSTLPLWVCPNCRRSVEEVEKKSGLSSTLDTAFLDQEFTVDSTSLPFLPDMSLGGSSTPSESASSNSSVCTCEACTERRQIEAEHEKETQELQKCWMELRKSVWLIYYRNGQGEGLEEGDHQLPDENRIKELVHRLCSRDPHQLFRRLESQAREFVLEKKVTLLRQLTVGHKTEVDARDFITRLLGEYTQLWKAARRLAGLLQELEQEHLKRFKVTWELHNKHLFQSIAYTDPLVQNSLPTLIKQLRQGAASKESYYDDSYPNLLHRYLKFDDEMSVVSVVWRDCQQLIEQYNEEQEALKVKQKMLKEDWEFFKQQRKLLEQQVLKRSNNNNATSQQLKCTAGLEAQFTETMRHLLQGTKPSPEECHCPRCNRKRCPCDECTITHMITCGIINPDTVDNSASQAPTFNHDPGRYIIDVTPPSMSSTSSSSGPSSPILGEPDSLALPFEDCQEEYENGEDIAEEIEDSQTDEEGEEEEEEEDDDEDYDDDDEEEEEEEDDDDEEDEGEDEGEGEEEEDEECEEIEVLGEEGGERGEENMAVPAAAAAMQAWLEESSQQPHQSFGLSSPTADSDTQNKLTNCDCHHCISQAKAQQVMAEESSQCQCHVCLQQQGKIVSTSLPQHLPSAPRPELHLYPHIHGQTSPMRPLLQPHLYDLHMPVAPHQPKPVISPDKVPLKLDFDTPEGLQEHMYHAYGEWDNTYNAARMLIGTHKYGGGLGTELLPPPPLPTSGPFINDPLPTSMDGSAFISPILSSALSGQVPNSAEMIHSFDAQSSVATTAMSQPPAAQTESCQKATVKRATRSASNIKHQLANQSQLNGQFQGAPQVTPVSRPATMGGNSAIHPGDKIQRCKHNLPLPTQSKISTTQHLNHGAPTLSAGGHSMGVGAKIPPDRLLGTVPRKEDGAKLALNGGGANLNLNSQHMCSHGHSRAANHLHQTGGMTLAHTEGCANAMALAGNNVSVGTSTCMDPDCETHHDDNYDSVDDSGSEQSSSTSTSNQKEGKYCDCCYCEFFGHSNPPSLPTSKNYAEMRDKLRLRLKRKKELKQDDSSPLPISPTCISSSKQTDPLEVKGLDELVKFINGVEEPKDKQLSSKAAKRARQKQRKADERARNIQEEKQRLKMAEKAKQLKLQESSKSRSSGSSHSVGKTSQHSAQKNCLEKDVLGHHHHQADVGESPGPQRKKKRSKPKESCRLTEVEGKLMATSQKTAPNLSSLSENKIVKVIRSKQPSHCMSTAQEARSAIIHQIPRSNHVIGGKILQPTSSDVNEKMKKSGAKPPDTPTPMSRLSASPRQTPTRSSINKKLPFHVSSTSTPHSPLNNVVSNSNAGHRPGEQPMPGKPASTAVVSQESQHAKQQQQQQQQQPIAKKPTKKHQVQVQQNNLNNLGAHHQSPVMRNGILIQQANCQLNGQKWTLPDKDKAPLRAPVHSSSPSPAQTTNGRPALEKKGPSPSIVRGQENGHTNNVTRPQVEQLKNQTGKNKKKAKKNRNSEDSNHIDEIFMPRTDSDLENGEMDDFERELEEFKRFCFDSAPVKREKLQVNVNLKDIFSKKKSGLGCS